MIKSQKDIIEKHEWEWKHEIDWSVCGQIKIYLAETSFGPLK